MSSSSFSKMRNLFHLSDNALPALNNLSGNCMSEFCFGITLSETF